MIEINVIDQVNVIYLFVFLFLGKKNSMKLFNFWLHVIEISEMGSQYDSHTTKKSKQKKKRAKKIAQIKVRMKNYVLK